MFSRLTHAAIAFAVTAVLYQVYVLVAVPFLEPPILKAKFERQLAAEELQAAREPLHKHRAIFAEVFPAGHWTLTRPPKTLASDEAMVVLDDYRAENNGQVRVTRCAILFFPTERIPGQPAPRDVVVLEAPHGAVLQLDEDFQPDLGGFGRLQWGKLLGEITVRSDMHEPGPEDDLLLTTRDLDINEDLIRTDADVKMRLGPHWGQGRVLEIRLLSIERGRADSMSPSIGGIDSLEILQEVEAQLDPGALQLIANEKEPPDEQQPPVNISAAGRFQYHFGQNKASFSNRVKIEQVHSSSLRDQVRCQQLNIYFAGRQDTVSTPSDEQTESVGARTQALAGLRPGLIETLGSTAEPVIVDLPSQQALARCQRMRIEVEPRRVTFDRGGKVMLSYQGSEIHAPQIRYQAPPEGASYQVGELLAAGNGWIRSAESEDPEQGPFEARWMDALRLSRVDGAPVLSLRGRPRLTLEGVGRLFANDLDLYLRERAADGSEDELLPAEVVPRRLVATGKVVVDTAELQGEVNQLEIDVDYAPHGLMLSSPDGNDSAAKPRFASGGASGNRIYHAEGDKLKGLVTVRDKHPEVSQLDLHGKVRFRETSLDDSSDKPLEVQAEEVQISDADSPHAEIALAGQPATITAAGMSIQTERLKIHRGESRATIETPGELQLPLTRDFSGKPLSAPRPLTVRWQGGMQLEHDQITFRDKVSVASVDALLDTARLVITLSEPIQFDGAVNQAQTDVAQIECRGGVNVLFNQRDEMGLTSRQVMYLEESLLANLHTGLLRGTGPGEVESVHLSNGASPVANLTGAGPQPNITPAASSRGGGQRLQFLRVEFSRGLIGNLHRKQVEAVGNVHTVYGPVDSWQQRLMMSYSGRPQPETVWITSDRLGVVESPMARMQRAKSGLGPIELYANGDVTIEGPVGERGMFTAHADAATFDQQKTLFVLTGKPGEPATLTHQQYEGAPFSEQSFERFSYNLTTREVRVKPIRSEILQRDPAQKDNSRNPR